MTSWFHDNAYWEGPREEMQPGAQEVPKRPSSKHVWMYDRWFDPTLALEPVAPPPPEPVVAVELPPVELKPEPVVEVPPAPPSAWDKIKTFLKGLR